MKAVVQTSAGEPSSTLRLQDIPTLAPGEDNVVIDVDLTSVHHGDLFMARLVRNLPPGQTYLRRGSEAVGRISAIGSAIAARNGLNVGDRVAAFAAPGAWAEQFESPVSHAFRVPDDLPDSTAAQLFVNTVTARMVLRGIRTSVAEDRLRSGVILLTGASTALARILARFMLPEGLTMVALTRSDVAAGRSRTLIPEVAYIATASDGWKDALASATAGRPIVAVADCVSGAFLAELSPLLADDAAIITYGGLDPNPIGLTGLEVTSRQFEVRGITLGRWFTETPREIQQEDIETSIALARTHPELFTVASVHSLEEWTNAVSAVERPGRDGFVFLRPR